MASFHLTTMATMFSSAVWATTWKLPFRPGAALNRGVTNDALGGVPSQ
jgi:hypothetical protein